MCDERRCVSSVWVVNGGFSLPYRSTFDHGAGTLIHIAFAFDRTKFDDIGNDVSTSSHHAVIIAFWLLFCEPFKRIIIGDDGIGIIQPLKQNSAHQSSRQPINSVSTLFAKRIGSEMCTTFSVAFFFLVEHKTRIQSIFGSMVCEGRARSATLVANNNNKSN